MSARHTTADVELRGLLQEHRRLRKELARVNTQFDRHIATAGAQSASPPPSHKSPTKPALLTSAASDPVLAGKEEELEQALAKVRRLKRENSRLQLKQGSSLNVSRATELQDRTKYLDIKLARAREENESLKQVQRQHEHAMSAATVPDADRERALRDQIAELRREARDIRQRCVVSDKKLAEVHNALRVEQVRHGHHGATALCEQRGRATLCMVARRHRALADSSVDNVCQEKHLKLQTALKVGSRKKSSKSTSSAKLDELRRRASALETDVEVIKRTAEKEARRLAAQKQAVEAEAEKLRLELGCV